MNSQIPSTVGQPHDTLSEAEGRLRAIAGVGFTPFAMLWKPDDRLKSQSKWNPAADDDWRKLRREWARPAIIHAR